MDTECFNMSPSRFNIHNHLTSTNKTSTVETAS
jgi:hypothetical protein